MVETMECGLQTQPDITVTKLIAKYAQMLIHPLHFDTDWMMINLQ